GPGPGPGPDPENLGPDGLYHQGSSWSREQQLIVHLEFFNSKFHSTIQSKRTQM
ncbi:unnamed protein product, partial [Rotaria magnacalcarata]